MPRQTEQGTFPPLAGQDSCLLEREGSPRFTPLIPELLWRHENVRTTCCETIKTKFRQGNIR